MGKKIIAVNAGPRKGWNTDMLITEAFKGAESAGAEVERLPCCNERPIPVLLIMTSNAPDTMYSGLIGNYQQTLTRFVGPTEVFVSGNTLQLMDYSKTDWPWTMFDAEAKKRRRETVFPEECRRVRQMGEALVK